MCIRDRRGTGDSRRESRADLRAFLYRPAAGEFRPELGARSQHLAADRARPWRASPRGEPPRARRGPRQGRCAHRRQRRRPVRHSPAGGVTLTHEQREDLLARELVHGTCVALGKRAALLRGASGSGKSDLALRFLALAGEAALRPLLIADDQVWVEAQENGEALASVPETLAGLIEVLGLGIAEMPFEATARLVLVCDLVPADQVPRLPPDPWDRTALAGIVLPALKLWAFEPSAPLKLRMALLQAPEQ